MDKQLTVLITRPQPGADAFADMLRDVPVMISPMMEIEHIKSDLGAPDVVVITSSYALWAVAPGSTVYCVGEATTQKAAEAGHTAVMAGETAEAVAHRLIEDRPDGRIVYARGRHIAFDMLGALHKAGLSAEEVVVYDQVSAPLTEEAQGLLASGAPVILPLFSARSSELFFAACPEGANLYVIAMSDAVAKTIARPHTNHLTILPNPDATTMAGHVRNAWSGGNRLEHGL